MAASTLAQPWDILPKITSSTQVERLTHSQYTQDENGNYKHPFVNAPSDLQTIHFLKSSSFSTKLHRVSQRASLNGHGRGANQRAKQNVEYETPLKNHGDINYVGQVYVGTPSKPFWVVWDTGSGSFLLKTTDCDFCDGEKFSIN